MVFKSKLKEELLQELKDFISWYHSQLVNDLVGPVYIDEPLTRQTVASVTVYNDFSVSVGLTDPKENLLFEFEIDFMNTQGSDYVVIKYCSEEGSSSVDTLRLTDIEGIDRFLVQAIKVIPSETYIKHYLNIFQNHIRGWLVF